ncbi:MAG TPA: hypothetical protein VLA75_10135, partial [Thermoanaerobaculia bacterium]|nr:hypothetical protein [Thermoanaerobaculia bacterium]
MSPSPSRRGALAAFLLALFALLAAPAAWAQGEIVWVEIEVVLDDAGQALVTYQARWQTSGKMRAFYFQGEQAEPRFEGGEAELPGGERWPLAITEVESGRWDIALAEDRAWGPGEATYTFTYRADLAASGQMGLTSTDDGEELAYLNWSPVAWDEPLAHETLVVRFPSVALARSGELPLEEASAATGLRTEPWVNERYLITYRGEGDPPALWVRFHRDDVGAREDHRVQLYLPAANFPGLAEAAERRVEEERAQAARRAEAERLARGRRLTLVLPLLLGLAALTLLVAGRKLKGLVRAAATAPDLLWERADWEPPRLRLSTFRKPGKVAELTDLEALVLLGLPFQ